MSYKNILLIDDDSEDTDVFLEAVNSLDKNINCLVQNNPVQALEYLKNLEILPDLMFVDFNMPVLNGNELIGRMREVVRLQAIPVILYSSYSELQQIGSLSSMTRSILPNPAILMNWSLY